MENKEKNTKGGFIELIIIIIIALIIMNYYGITISGALHWFEVSLKNVLR